MPSIYLYMFKTLKLTQYSVQKKGILNAFFCCCPWEYTALINCTFTGNYLNLEAVLFRRFHYSTQYLRSFQNSHLNFTYYSTVYVVSTTWSTMIFETAANTWSMPYFNKILFKDSWVFVCFILKARVVWHNLLRWGDSSQKILIKHIIKVLQQLWR